MASPDIIEFTTDPQLLGLSLSLAQETLLRAIYGLDLNEEQLDLWRECTDRHEYPGKPFGEVTVVSGARSGKDSRIAAPVALYESLFGGHERHLSPGERAIVPVVAQDARATAIAFGYIRDGLRRSPILASTVVDERASEIDLENRVTIRCFPCTMRSLRGWSIPVGILDEVAFWRIEGSADSDVEVQTSFRRGGLGFPSPKLLKISTPYLRSGILYNDFAQSFGKDDPDRLVWKSRTSLMNPSITEERLAREKRLDPKRYAREYEAEFQDDLESFLSPEWVERCVVPGRFELPPAPGVRHVAGVDPSGGRGDFFTLSICHEEGSFSEGRRVVQDFMKGWQGGDLEETVQAIAAVLCRYGVSFCAGDRYAGSWVSEAFKRHGIRYVHPVARMKTPSGDTTRTHLDKSMAYVELEGLIAGGRIEILDHAKLFRELQPIHFRFRRIRSFLSSRRSVRKSQGFFGTACATNGEQGDQQHSPHVEPPSRVDFSA